MVDRRSLVTGVPVIFAVFVAMSGVSAWAQAPAAPAAGAPAAGAGRGGQGPGGPGRGGGGGFGRGTAFTPTPGAKDLKSGLYNWTRHMGILRSWSESELIKTLDYQAQDGKVQMVCQTCQLTLIRVPTDYLV